MILTRFSIQRIRRCPAKYQQSLCGGLPGFLWWWNWEWLLSWWWECTDISAASATFCISDHHWSPAKFWRRCGNFCVWVNSSRYRNIEWQMMLMVPFKIKIYDIFSASSCTRAHFDIYNPLHVFFFSIFAVKRWSVRKMLVPLLQKYAHPRQLQWRESPKLNHALKLKCLTLCLKGRFKKSFVASQTGLKKKLKSPF